MFNAPLSGSGTTRNIFTVSKLNGLARSVLEKEIGQIWLSAEISNFVAASSGHWYFTLKDSRAQVKAAMFKGANRRVQQKPKEGDKVLVRANLSLYEARGDYQLIVEHLEPEGEGQLKQQFELLKVKLAGEGLFAQQYKQVLPEIILRVGIITSATGAALHDILSVMKRRNPAIQAIIYPSQVQGDTASTQICSAIEVANNRKEVDVLLVGRGGGSLEDLWCFNQEDVARAIFASRLPIISAVGHEIDVSIADFVADMRAPTPSAAAELVSREQSELFNNIEYLQEKLHKLIATSLKEASYQQQVMVQKLQQQHPRNQLQQQFQNVDRLHTILSNRFERQLYLVKNTSEKLINRLHMLSPKHLLLEQQQKAQTLQDRLQQGVQQLLNGKQTILASNAHLLDTVSPLGTLSRGYSISFKQGEIVKSASQLSKGDQLVSRFVDGEVVSEVLS
jgi:exodeoxyribonuclease VII large subunit